MAQVPAPGPEMTGECRARAPRNTELLSWGGTPGGLELSPTPWPGPPPLCPQPLFVLNHPLQPELRMGS